LGIPDAVVLGDTLKTMQNIKVLPDESGKTFYLTIAERLNKKLTAI
jgi:hypothetical protein